MQDPRTSQCKALMNEIVKLTLKCEVKSADCDDMQK